MVFAPPKLCSEDEVLYPWCDGVSGGVGGEEDTVRRCISQSCITVKKIAEAFLFFEVVCALILKVYVQD